jgi:hypothetical protein
MPKNLIEDIHYYLEDGRIVFTPKYHEERGFCCSNKCRHCPYDPKYIKGTTKINEKESEE